MPLAQSKTKNRNGLKLTVTSGGRLRNLRAIDLFCGAGGCSWGARRAGARIIAGFDKWDLALRTFKDNFPEARVFSERIQDLSVRRVAAQVRKIDLILASPECTSHSLARGGSRPSEDSRMTAFQIIRFARRLKPRWIVIENVSTMRSWRRYREFVRKLQKLGYKTLEQTINAADFGVAQSRKRLFILCDRKSTPSRVNPRTEQWAKASSIVSLNGEHPLTDLWTKRPNTLKRARRAIRALGRHSTKRRRSFLLVYYGSDKHVSNKGGGWQRLDVPLRTVTTLDRFALVKPYRNTYKMRMLQVDELRKAMGFKKTFRLAHGNRRDKIHLLGNAVCPPVIEAILRSLTTGRKQEKRQ